MNKTDFSEKEKQLYRRIEHDHEFFRYRMLSKQRADIYEACNRIRFVECVYEYLTGKENIKAEYLNAIGKCRENIFDELYRVYLNNEFTKVGTWEEVDDFMDILIREQKNWYELIMLTVS